MLFYLSPAAECFCLPAERGVMDLGSIFLVFHWCLSFSSPAVVGFPPVASGHRFGCCPLKSQAFLLPGDRGLCGVSVLTAVSSLQPALRGKLSQVCLSGHLYQPLVGFLVLGEPLQVCEAFDFSSSQVFTFTRAHAQSLAIH